MKGLFKNKSIGLIIGLIFAISDGTLGVIELIIVSILSIVITRFFERKIGEAIAEINGYTGVASLLNDYFVKNETYNDIGSSIINMFGDLYKNKARAEFNRKMKIWINVSQFGVFIITMVIAIIFDL